jgi:hypothetical protein
VKIMSRVLHAGAVFVFISSLINPCLAKVKTFVNANVDLNTYKTYQWLPPRVLTNKGIVEDDPTVGPAIKAAVNHELKARGLVEVEQGGELLVSTGALTSYFPQLEALIFPGVIGANETLGNPIATMGRYNREGTLAVNLIDAKNNKSAWAGLITDSIDDKPGSGVKKLPKAAASLFGKYPVKKKNNRAPQTLHTPSNPRVDRAYLNSHDMTTTPCQ